MKFISRGSKTYQLFGRRKPIFTDFDFSVDDGCTVIMGPNGCGKSTLLRILLGLETLDSGIRHYNPSRPDLLSTVLQNYKSQLLPKCTLDENIRIIIERQSKSFYTAEEAISATQYFLHEFGFKMDNCDMVGNLSGGEQQAIVVARSFLSFPKLCILDEPVSAIDFRRRTAILQAIYNRSRGNRTVMCSHDINDAILIGRRIIVFSQNMEILMDKLLPDYEAFNTKDRLNSKWAVEVREEMLNLTHHIRENEN